MSLLRNWRSTRSAWPSASICRYTTGDGTCRRSVLAVIVRTVISVMSASNAACLIASSASPLSRASFLTLTAPEQHGRTHETSTNVRVKKVRDMSHGLSRAASPRQKKTLHTARRRGVRTRRSRPTAKCETVRTQRCALETKPVRTPVRRRLGFETTQPSHAHAVHGILSHTSYTKAFHAHTARG